MTSSSSAPAETKLQTPLFRLNISEQNSKKLYHFTVQPLTDERDAWKHFEQFAKCMKGICENPNFKSLVLLDCSQVEGMMIVKMLVPNMDQMMNTDSCGLDRFVMVTTNDLLRKTAEKFIVMKNAQNYTFIVDNLEKALKMVV